MNMDIDYFGKGDHVNVKDDFGNFDGVVKGFNDGYVIVEDKDGGCWSVEPHKLTFNSDEYIH